MRTYTRPSPRRSASERRELLRQLSASGLTLSEFSRRTGIPTGTLSNWRHVERRRAAEGSKRAEPLVPVEVIDEPRTVARGSGDVARSGESAVVVELAAGHRVLLPATLGPEVLAQLLGSVLPC